MPDFHIIRDRRDQRTTRLTPMSKGFDDREEFMSIYDRLVHETDKEHYDQRSDMGATIENRSKLARNQAVKRVN